jgi:hypothetical protein
VTPVVEQHLASGRSLRSVPSIAKTSKSPFSALHHYCFFIWHMGQWLDLTCALPGGWVKTPVSQGPGFWPTASGFSRRVEKRLLEQWFILLSQRGIHLR